MKEYKPAEHSETSNVAPLVQFFELVHIGDTIQSMVQVYFDKELVCWLSPAILLCLTIISFSIQAPHIDRTDFLNVVVREKKRFENTLDDSVAAGLNAGTEVLMSQVRTKLDNSGCTKIINSRLTTLSQSLRSQENIIRLRMTLLSLAQQQVV